jgi:hypothetical protein
METMQLHSRIGADGVLRLELPFEPADADTDVVITIEPVRAQAPSTWGSLLSDNFASEPARRVPPPAGEREASTSR